MNCEEVESLLADALGEELSAPQRTALEAHWSECERCREEHASLRGAVEVMRRLTRPKRAQARRVGDRLILESSAGSTIPRSDLARERKWYRGVLRYAAGLGIAFLAGYVVRGSGESAESMAHRPPSVAENLERGEELSKDWEEAKQGSVLGAFLHARSQHMSRSELGQVLIALAGKRG